MKKKRNIIPSCVSLTYRDEYWEYRIIIMGRAPQNAARVEYLHSTVLGYGRG